MPIGTDEKVLSIDGYIAVDPALGLRQRCQDFLLSRSWATDQVFYGDQPEPLDPEADGPEWSLGFNYGLDHIRTAGDRWRDDVAALVTFVQALQGELENEFEVDVRSRSKLWHSEHITFVDERPLDIARICDMIRRVA